MKILFICDKLITFILNDISELTLSGHEVSILSIHRDKRIYEKIVHPYLIEHDLEKRFFINWNIDRSKKGKIWSVIHFIQYIAIDVLRKPVVTLKSLQHLFAIYDSLWKACEEYNYLRRIFPKQFDVLHAPFSTPEIIKKIYFLSKILNIPYTLSFRAHDLYNERDFSISLRKRYILEQASSVLTISKYNKKILQESLANKQKIQVIHAGVETDFFCPLPMEKSKNRIISIGRFHEQKGLIHLLEACVILRERKIPFACTLIGEGPEHDALVHFITTKGLNQIQCIEYLDRDGIKQELAKSEIFVLPCIVASDGLRDMLANAMKEAMAMELPVITSAISGVEELVVDGQCGILTNPGDPLAIADAIEKLLSNDALRIQMGKSARRQIAEQFNVSVEAKKLEAIFLEATSSNFLLG